MLLGLIVFVLVFVAIAPQSQTYLGGLFAATGVWIADWAPFSYLLLLILLAAPFVGIHLVRTWPVRVEEENPMAKYRKEMPLDED
jgi:di/tricarboxylate transporter